MGWPSKKYFGKSILDVTGARFSPAYPNPSEKPCVSLYGDSFTKGSEVDNEHCWANQLARLIHCRVANYGVGAYGTDQALLRYISNTFDTARVVILNHQSENIIRNVNQYRQLIYHHQEEGFKPRFILMNDTLQHIAKPVIQLQQYEDFCKNPARYLEHEYFIPGGPSGIQTAGFPYSLSLVKSFRHYQVQAKLKGKSGYFDFYDPSHPSGALQLTKAIMVKFVVVAKQRNQIPVLTIIPNGLDLQYYKQHKQWPYQNLIDELAKENICVLNMGTGILDRQKVKDLKTIFTNINGHYNEKGNSIIANIVCQYLADSIFKPQKSANISMNTLKHAQQSIR